MLDEAHHRLTVGMNVDMLNRHLLLALATMAIQVDIKSLSAPTFTAAASAGGIAA
jgi:hypothetical protein